MKKSIMLSINPKWVAKIMNGEKEYEIRKTKPNCELPIDVYIYCTKDETPLVFDINYDLELANKICKSRGKVVAKFTLDEAQMTCGWRLKGKTGFCAKRTMFEEQLPKKSCLSIDEIIEYANKEDDRAVYAWHISNLVIFDKPKELSEFGLKRAPESWQYVEVE